MLTRLHRLDPQSSVTINLLGSIASTPRLSKCSPNRGRIPRELLPKEALAACGTSPVISIAHRVNSNATSPAKYPEKYERLSALLESRHSSATVLQLASFTLIVLITEGLSCMKKAITVRLDPELLEEVRLKAEDENRTLTNFIATALKERLRPASSGERTPANGQK